MKVICKKNYGKTRYTDNCYLKGEEYKIIEITFMSYLNKYPIPCKWFLIQGEFDCEFNFAVEKMKGMNYFHEHFITIAETRKLKLDQISTVHD